MAINLQLAFSSNEQDMEIIKPITQAKYIHKLIENSISLEEEDAREAGRIGYMARTLVQATFPYKDPRTNEFIRKNGNYTLEMIAPSSIGLPYGSMPRVILAWITSEAVRNKSKHIYLGENLSTFIHRLGFENTGGKNGDITRVKEQLKRLLRTHITVSYIAKNIEQIKNIQTISQSHSLWVNNVHDSTIIWQTELILNQDFFDEIITHPVPIDLGVIQAIKNSPLAIDIYCWATYRCYSLRKDILIPWDKLFLQFGTGYANDKSGKYAFKKKFIEQLRKVCLMYKQLNVDPQPSGLLLKKSSTHISSKPKELFKQDTQCLENPSNMDNKIHHSNYKKYVINEITHIIQEKLTSEEKTKFSQEFDDYIFRNKLKCSYKNLLDEKTKEPLYNFINSRWTHLLENIMTLNEFTLKNKKEILVS